MRIRANTGTSYDLVLKIRDTNADENCQYQPVLEGAKVVVFCYSIDNLSSFKGVFEDKESIAEQPDLFSVIIGNKSDLERSVPIVKMEDKKEAMPNCKYATEISTLANNEMIDYLFQRLS